jgi:predicted AlkP superfamily phosphohydrolase/phosphomutase
MENSDHKLYNKVIVFGLDGATFNILMPWIEAGELPFLKKMIDEGVHGELLSTIPPITASAFVSFQTGKTPAHHEIFDFSRYIPGSYETPIINSSVIKPKTIWQILSSVGKRIIAINVPITFPPKPVNGYMVSGLLSPNINQACYPPELAEEITKLIPDFEFIVPIRTIDFLGLDEFIARLTKLSEKRATLAKYLLKRNWDFFMLHFQDTDTGQHAFWSYIDPIHPAYGDHSESDRQKVLGLYKRIDQLMAEIYSEVEKETLVMVMSDHGFGPAIKRIYINEWLLRQDLLRVKKTWKRKIVGWGVKTIIALDFLKLRRRFIKSHSRGEKLQIRITHTNLIDWTKTVAYALPGTFYARIYLNLKDREPEGIVDPKDSSTICQQIKAKLLELRDSKTGQSVFNHVYLKDEIYPGTTASSLPDIIVEPARGYIFATDLVTNTIFRSTPNFFTGTHEREGIFAAYGPGVPARKQIHDANLVDLMPTILYALGVPIPNDLDGKILKDVFPIQYMQDNLPMFVEAESITQSSSSDLSVEEQALIEERLRNLGYLG